MAVKKGGLGKGLDSLIPSGAPKNKKNIAEVILAKHRGGSTGTVELLWLGNYTKFANLDKYRE